MEARRRLSVPPSKTRKYSWAAHPWKQILLYSLRKPTGTLGRVIDVEQISEKEKILRKKYLVLRRLDSTKVISMMKPFPTRPMQQMIRKTVKRKPCRLVWTENPRRRNPGPAV